MRGDAYRVVEITKQTNKHTRRKVRGSGAGSLVVCESRLCCPLTVGPGNIA
jgi:hypothetical protein